MLNKLNVLLQQIYITKTHTIWDRKEYNSKTISTEKSNQNTMSIPMPGLRGFINKLQYKLKYNGCFRLYIYTKF